MTSLIPQEPAYRQWLWRPRWREPFTWTRLLRRPPPTVAEAAQRYCGLRYGQHIAVTDGDAGLLVRSEVARRQLKDETDGDHDPEPVPEPGLEPTPPTPPPAPPASPKPRRFYGTVSLNPARAGRDASKITDEVITHLVGLIGSSVRLTLEIDAEIPAGVPDNVVRTVTENSRTLKFTSHGFASE